MEQSNIEMASFEKKDSSEETIDQNLINNKYKVIKKIGSGSFGDVYSSTDNTEREYAIKFELIKKKNDINRLKKEYQIYNLLKYSNKFINLYWYGEYKNHRVLVMERIEKSLKEIFNYNHNVFSTNSICNISMQMIDILEELHNNSVIHQDIKPANILFNKNNQKIYLIDFGISSIWKEDSIQTRSGKYIGTSRYASISSHNCYTQSRKDDLESLGYVLIYLAKGRLPWQGITEKDLRKKWNRVRNFKEIIGNKTLCRGLKKCYYYYIKYVQTLNFHDKPNYSFLKGLFSRYTKNTNVFY
jgi:serine/threonine protein kinase